MKITYAPSETGVNAKRMTLDNLSGTIARAWVSEDSSALPGSVVDVQIRYADYNSDRRNWLYARLYDRPSDSEQSGDVLLLVDRIHVY